MTLWARASPHVSCEREGERESRATKHSCVPSAERETRGRKRDCGVRACTIFMYGVYPLRRTPARERERPRASGPAFSYGDRRERVEERGEERTHGAGVPRNERGKTPGERCGDVTYIHSQTHLLHKLYFDRPVVRGPHRARAHLAQLSQRLNLILHIFITTNALRYQYPYNIALFDSSNRHTIRRSRDECSCARGAFRLEQLLNLRDGARQLPHLLRQHRLLRCRRHLARAAARELLLPRHAP